MRNGKKQIHKLISILLILVMFVSWLPTNIFANELVDEEKHMETMKEETEGVDEDTVEEPDETGSTENDNKEKEVNKETENKKEVKKENNEKDSTKAQPNSKELSEEEGEQDNKNDKSEDSEEVTKETTKESDEESNEESDEESDKESDEESEEKTLSKEELKTLVDASTNKTVQYYKNNQPEYTESYKGSHSDFWVFSALWSSGLKNLEKDFPWKEDSNPWLDFTYWSEGKTEASKDPNENAGAVIGSLILGLNPYEFGEQNLVEDLLELQNDRGMFSTIWGEAWAFIALDLVDADYDQDKHIKSILNEQSNNGLFGDTDATGWTLLALAPHMERADVKEAVGRAVDYIHEEFVENDEYPGMFGPNANTTSSVIMGLAAVGEDLYSDKWTKENGSLLEDLLDYQQDDGSFWWQKQSAGAIGMATEQALLALATVEHGQSPFISMKNELDIPELPGNSEEPKETILPFNKEVTAHSKEIFEIADTQNTVTMPSNLPENTTIQVKDVTKETDLVDNNLSVAGNVLSFTLNHQATSEDPFELTMSVNENVDLTKQDVDIFYYDEEKNQWVKQNGQIDQDKRTITIHPTDFSTYGVFAINDEPKVDTSKLEASIEKAENETLDDKTTDSKKKFEEALEVAIAILNKTDATQEEIDEAQKALEKAMENLKDRAPPVKVNVRVESHGQTLVPTTEVEVSPYDLMEYINNNNNGKSLVHDEARAIHAIIRALETVDGFDPKDDQQFGLNNGGNYIQKIGDAAEFSAGPLSGWMYYVNNEFAPVGVADFKVKDGDSIVLYFVENYIDSTYTWFDKESYKTKVDESLSLTLKGEKSVEGAHILIDGKPYEVDGEKVLIDKDGKVNITFSETGTYHVSAERLNDAGENNIVRPYTIVEVIDTDVVPEKDTTPPSITITGINDGQKVLNEKIEFSVKAEDDVDGQVDADVKLNGKTVKPTKSTSYAVKLKEGENTISVEAEDSSNNKAKKEIIVTYEKPKIEESAENALTALKDYVLKTGVDSDWLAISLYQSGEKLPKSYKDVFVKNVNEQIVGALKNGRLTITDVERLTLAALALEVDPRNVDGVNLIELIYNSPDRTLYDGTVVDTMTYQGNNGLAFALIALDAGQFDIPEDAKWTREAIIEELLENQRKDGAWNLNEQYDVPNIDITAMVLTALAPYKNEDQVEKAIKDGFAFLSSVQNADGGFDGGEDVGGVTSEAASQVIIALTANGMDPKDEQFNRSVNVVDHLLNYQLDNGGFTHLFGDSEANDMATEQAFLALTAYKLFVEEGKSIYDFGVTDDENLDGTVDLEDEVDENPSTDDETSNSEEDPEQDSEQGSGQDSEQGSGQDSEQGSGQDSGKDSEQGSGQDSGKDSEQGSEQDSEQDSGQGSGQDSEQDSEQDPEQGSEQDSEQDSGQGSEQDSEEADDQVIGQSNQGIHHSEENIKDMDDNDEQLPNTATNMYNYMLIGLLFMMIGFSFILLRRKNALKK
ncbi:DUF4430 domain-containing protein [Pseudogracilibacillus sp. ICA-222130]|uniref:DUF4430 domain-containing protein n=1 Tax=Pseudogracilibacillus sp. ICA-222130 TaxID=3134655 RepID=UPI0030C1B31D